MNRRTKYLMWLLVLAMVMACAPAFSTVPTVPTLDPGAIDRIIAQTADAASTQTAAALPSSTPTETNTPIPRGTDTPEPTVTETIVFLFETPTLFILPPATITPTRSNKDYLCEVLSSPTNGTIYSPRLEFKVRWRFKNVGRQKWDPEIVHFIYDRGDRFHKTSSYNLEKAIDVGYVAELFVEMEAPKDPGTYTTYWALQANGDKFCKVSLTIGVK